MYKNKIPKASVYRLAIYLRGLEKLKINKKIYVSSPEVGKFCGIDPAQVRKDLSYFGQFGEVGKGYHIKSLVTNLKKILKLHHKKWKMSLAGVGNLGAALLSYKGFENVGFIIQVAFDKDCKKIGRVFSGVKIYDFKKMKEIIRKENIRIGIIAVPAEFAQEVAEIMISSGVKSILNFAPVILNLPSKIIVSNVDLSNELLSLPYFISK
ncbi:MAG: redox-sensing transcriptional repressor Rex [Candidatus Saelkia tenebricola]|nr:redox-sensing transcriptional repressor Rex [Candidatus Saelkia tenebricola]